MSKAKSSDQWQHDMGAKIRELRKAHGMSLEELSAYLGITTGFLRLIENGKRGLAVPKIILLSEFFNVAVDELVKPSSGTSTADKKDTVSLTKINSFARYLNISEQERLITIIKAAFPQSAESNSAGN